MFNSFNSHSTLWGRYYSPFYWWEKWNTDFLITSTGEHSSYISEPSVESRQFDLETLLLPTLLPFQAKRQTVCQAYIMLEYSARYLWALICLQSREALLSATFPNILPSEIQMRYLKVTFNSVTACELKEAMWDSYLVLHNKMSQNLVT